MPIYDQSYKHWEGTFKSHAFRWWVITKYGIKTAFKKRWVRRLFVFALLPFVAATVYIYGLTQMGKLSGFLAQISGQRQTEAFTGNEYAVEVEGKLEPFLDELEKQRFRWQGGGQEIKIKPPEGENSKKIRAIAKKTGTTIVRLIPPGADAEFYNGFLRWQSSYLFLLLIVVGGGLIAKDARFNALQIYLAKPITGMEYILGKLGIVVFFLTMVTLVPGLLQFLFQAILIGDSLYFRHYWWVPAAICGYSLLIVFSGSLLVLAFSALSRNDRSASFGVAAVFLFSPVIARLLSETGNPAYSLLSFRHNWTRLGQEMFGLKEKVGGWRSLPDVWWGWSLLVLVAIMVLCAVVLLRRVRGLEVVK